jgi:hypothetical protein
VVASQANLVSVDNPKDKALAKVVKVRWAMVDTINAVVMVDEDGGADGSLYLSDFSMM